MGNIPKPATETRTIAQFVGFHGTRRTISKSDQDQIVGVASGVGKEDLIWEPGNQKLDVTNAHPDVIDYLKSDSEFKVASVEVTIDTTAS